MKKRSKYRPRSVITDPLTLLRPATAEEKRSVMLCFLTALESMRAGDHPGEEEWRSLSDAINCIETLTLGQKKLCAAEVMPIVNDAIAAMVQAARRFKEGQGMRMDARGMEALRDVIAMYETCLDTFTSREMSLAQAETQRRVNELLRKRNPGREVVCI